MREKLNSLLQHPIKKVYFLSIVSVYLLTAITGFSWSFYTFLAYGQEIKEINTQIGYILTYNNQGGTGCTNEIQYGNNPWGELCTPTKEGYTFDGWYTEPDGEGTEVTNATLATSNQTVYAFYPPQTLYYVLKKAAKEGTYAREYTGEHQDSMDASLSTKEIYHWYGSNATNGTAILDKNNVIFANHCWQMIRTTDTGGVRMIYNGEVVDGKCLNTRGNHAGYSGRITAQDFNGTYWYGTDYAYDNGTFSITGTTSAVELNSSNASTIIPTLIGKYTCKSTSETGTCATLYWIEGPSSSGVELNVIKLSNSHYSQIGTLPFNASSTVPSTVGYMYNKIYQNKSKEFKYIFSISGHVLESYYYYGTSINYDSSTNKYTLVNPQLVSSVTDISQLIGKYMLEDGLNTPSTKARYIIDISESSIDVIEWLNLKDGNLNISMVLGNSYVDNGNGTYTLQNTSTLKVDEWYNADDDTKKSYTEKYVCDGSSPTCSDLKYITSTQPEQYGYYYYGVNNNSYKFGENVSYNNGIYTLTGDIKTLWNFAENVVSSDINTHHYTCFSATDTTCESVGYIYSAGSPFYYFELNSTNNIESALSDMLSANDVNNKDSIIKKGIEAWYKKYLLSYDSYIDDTIYCNDRSILSLGFFSPSGYVAGYEHYNNGYLKFNNSSLLSCTNITDKFSVSNNSAKLTYKVGLISRPELQLLNNNNARKTGKLYYTINPSYFSESTYPAARNYSVNTTGSITNFVTGMSGGVRPAISLKSSIRYDKGDGSMANPYVVDTSNN